MAVGHVTDLGSSLVVGRMARQFLPAVMEVVGRMARQFLPAVVEVVIAYPIMITYVSCHCQLMLCFSRRKIIWFIPSCLVGCNLSRLYCLRVSANRVVLTWF